MSLGQNIAQARKNKNISQEDLSTHLNVSRQSVSLWENDQTIPSLDKLKEISNFLEVSLDDLNSDNMVILKTKDNSIEKLKEKDKKTFGLICLFLTIFGVLLWMIPVFSIFINGASLITSCINLNNKKDKFISYIFVIISSVFLIASIIGTAIF